MSKGFELVGGVLMNGEWAIFGCPNGVVVGHDAVPVNSVAAWLEV